MALIDNAIAYYKLDETSGTTATDSVGSYNGTASSGTFDGSSGKINACANFTSERQITTSLSSAIQGFSLWFYGNTYSGTTTFDEWGSIFDQRSTTAGFALRRGGSTNRLYLLMSTGGWTDYNLNPSYNYFGDGNWHHVVVTDNGTDTLIYIDNSLIYTVSGKTLPNAGNLTIGNGGNGRGHNGYIDEVYIRSSEITSTEVSELYNGGNGLQYPFTVTDNTSNFFLMF